MSEKDARAHLFRPLTHAYAPEEEHLIEGVVQDLQRASIPFVLVHKERGESRGVAVWRAREGMARPGGLKGSRY